MKVSAWSFLLFVCTPDGLTLDNYPPPFWPTITQTWTCKELQEHGAGIVSFFLARVTLG